MSNPSFFLPPVKYPYPRRKGAKYVSAFQLSYQNKSCSECQQDVRKIERQAERQTDRRTDRQTDRIFSLVIKTKVVQNVNRMSKSQSDRWENIQ